jgi:phage baseplate assembly protein V
MLIEFIRNLITFGTIKRVDNSSTLLRGQIETQGVSKEHVLYSNYGFVSYPPLNSSSLAYNVAINGYEDGKFSLPFVTNPPSVQEGEVCIYNNLTDTKIHLDREGNLTINTTKDTVINTTGNLEATATAATVTASTISLTGDVTITGNLIVTGTLGSTGLATLTGGATISGKPFLTHIHSGVTPGPGNTGGVV